MLVLLLSLFTYSTAQNLRSNNLQVSNNDWNDFSHFQKRFNKQYSSIEELKSRFDIFRSNFRNIIKHNLDTTQNFTMGVNQFTDLTPEEFKTSIVSGFYNRVSEEIVLGSSCKNVDNVNSNLPDVVDWRNQNAVTPVKDQGQCGSCWSFSATGAMEGAWSISQDKLVSLSEQELVDCAGLRYGSMGCNGGQMDGAFKFVINNGLCGENDYPYTAVDGTCKSCSSIVKMSSCVDVKPNDQLALKEAVYITPVSIAIEADTKYFQSYASGVLTSETCGTNLDHGVLIVGYGEENSQKYWLVKNSWGTTWGDQGYIKIGRSESSNDAGICGIAMQPSYPIV